MAQQHYFFAVVLPGLEHIAAQELQRLSAHDIRITHGGVHFSGTVSLLYRVNLRARTITRVLMRLRTFRSMTLEGLKHDVRKVAWHLFFDEQTDLHIEVHRHHSRLRHTDEITAITQATLQKLLPKLGLSARHKQTLHIRIDNNRGVLSLDTSGERLDKRGYRLASGKAPLRETIAAAILQWSGWQPNQTLLVPMCGSGTIAIEAALMALQKAPNINHDFACLHYPSFKSKLFQKAVDKCLAMEKNIPLQILASDNNKSAVSICRDNTKRAGVDKHIHILQQDIHQLEKPETEHGGLLILNPPYGQRIGDMQKTMSLWASMGRLIKQRFMPDPSWKTVIVCPDNQHEQALKLPVKHHLRIKHGGRHVMLLEV